jgi:hypothetical protein
MSKGRKQSSGKCLRSEGTPLWNQLRSERWRPPPVAWSRAQSGLPGPSDQPIHSVKTVFELPL